MMKKRMAGILLGILFSAVLLPGCAKNEAAETASESAEIEKGENEEEAPEEEEPEEEEVPEEPAKKVGVFLPSDSGDTRWSADGQKLTEALEAFEYEVQLYWAGNDSADQVLQIEEAMEEETSALVVVPVDPYGLSETIDQAKELKIPVFSYDELIMDTSGVSYYVTFNTRSMGQMVGNAIVEQKELEKAREEKQILSIEFLMGDPQDNGALFFFNGVMEVLQPYFDDGTLVCPSQKQSFDDTAMLRRSVSAVQAELSGRLEEFYAQGEIPDIICTAEDVQAEACVELLKEEGILPGSEEWPVITGVGSEADAVKSVAEGEQACTVFADNRLLAEKCAEMVNAELSGEDPEVNDYEQYDNGKKIIGTYACDLQLIDGGNYQILIDNGYYTAEQVEPEITPDEDTSTESGEVLTVTPAVTSTEAPTATPAATAAAAPARETDSQEETGEEETEEEEIEEKDL